MSEPCPHRDDEPHKWRGVGVYTTTPGHGKPVVMVQCDACGIFERWASSKASLYDGWETNTDEDA